MIVVLTVKMKNGILTALLVGIIVTMKRSRMMRIPLGVKSSRIARRKKKKKGEKKVMMTLS